MQDLSKLYRAAYNAAVLCYYSNDWETMQTGATAIIELLGADNFTLDAKGLPEKGSFGNILKRSYELARNEVQGFASDGTYVLEALIRNNARYAKEIVKHEGLLDYFIEASRGNENGSGLRPDIATRFLTCLSRNGQGEAVALALLNPKRPLGAGEKKAPEHRPGKDTGR